MAAVKKDPRMFFTKGTAAQFDFVLNLYEEAIKLKAKQKNRKQEEFLKLDRWYQKDLPKKIKSRGKDAHLTHEELIKCMKWKLNRGKFSPRLKDLITMNTPRLCMAETKKAFRALSKKEDLPMAIQALCNLKGVGPAMASAILTAADPLQCGFMADECLLAIPDIESIDYTNRELLNFVQLLRGAADRLNSENGGITGEAAFNAHKIEIALWTHFVLTDLNKELLEAMPSGPSVNGIAAAAEEDDESKNGPSPSPSDSSADKENRTQIHTNGASEDSRSALSLCEDTNDSIAISEAPSESISELNNINSEMDEDSQDTRDVPSSSSSSPTSSKPIEEVESEGNSNFPIEINSNSSSETEPNCKPVSQPESKVENSLVSSIEELKTTNSISESATILDSTTSSTKATTEDTRSTEDEPQTKKMKLDQ